MFAATPPRRTSSSSTRKLTERLASWSGSSCSANLPEKVMRWSVAMDPVTAICTGGHASLSKRARVDRGGGHLCGAALSHGSDLRKKNETSYQRVGGGTADVTLITSRACCATTTNCPRTTPL